MTRPLNLEALLKTPRHCLGCNALLVRRPATEGKSAERLYYFFKRRCCNYVCAGMATHKSRKDPICRQCRSRDRAQRADGTFLSTCGDLECVLSARGRMSWHKIPWPEVTGEIDWNGAFGKHNIVAKDGGVLRVSRQLTHSPSSSSAAWAIMDTAT